MQLLRTFAVGVLNSFRCQNIEIILQNSSPSTMKPNPLIYSRIADERRSFSLLRAVPILSFEWLLHAAPDH